MLRGRLPHDQTTKARREAGPQMSWEATTWARSVQDIDPTSKLVLLLLADHVSKEGIVYPAISKLAEDACVGRNTVKRRLALLVEKGLISVRERFRADGSRASNEYVLNLTYTPPGS